MTDDGPGFQISRPFEDFINNIRMPISSGIVQWLPSSLKRDRERGEERDREKVTDNI
jgi:hypothetical protein